MENQEKELEEKPNKEEQEDSKESFIPMATEELLFMINLVNEIVELILKDKEYSHEKTYQKIRCRSEKYYMDNRGYYLEKQFIFHEDIIINHNNANIIIEGLDKLQYEDMDKALEMHEISETGFLGISRLILLLSNKSFWDELYEEAKKDKKPSIKDYSDGFYLLKEKLQSHSKEVEMLSYIPISIKKTYKLALSILENMFPINRMTEKAKSLFLYKLLIKAGVEKKGNGLKIAHFIAKLTDGDEKTIYGYFKMINKEPKERRKLAGEYIGSSCSEIIKACEPLLNRKQSTESVFEQIYHDFVVMKEEECDIRK